MIQLKVTTEYSILKSLIKLPDLIAFLVNHNMTCGAICDDELFGVIDFYNACKDNGIKPIIGLDVTINNLHFYLYPKNYLGYLKLLKINTLKFQNDLKISNLEDENILVIIPYASKESYQEFRNKENIYLGYSNEEEKKNVFIVSKNIIYVKDVKTLQKNDIKYLKYLKLMNDNLQYNQDDFYDINFSDDDKRKVQAFCDRINIEMQYAKRYIPVFKENVNSFDYLKTLALKGIEKRCGALIPSYLKRLDEELNVIKSMGFVDYFLIVYDYVLYAKKNNILVGPGRGSAAGSLVSYAIGITNIDPLKYDLSFARFLNPSRKKMPDIDIDFEDSKRMDIIEYVRKRYGSKNVALGITFNTLKTKLVLRDTAKILNIDNDLLEKFLKVIDGSQNLKINLKSEKVKKYIDLYPQLKELYDISLHLENLKKNISTHAAGVVISSNELDEVIPIYNDGEILKTGIAMEHLEKIGLLKMDFLGLKNLSLISSIISKIDGLKLEEIPLDDAKTFKVFQEADTDDIFQFESNYAKQNLLKIKPQNFDELALAIALVRPGPSNQIDSYVKNKNNDNLNIHPDLAQILNDTKGVIIFQEQVMKILEVIGGYTPYEADNVRAAMSKKKQDIILKEKDVFMQNGLKKGYNLDFLTDIFNQICRFAEYGFNKAHSVSYALIAYRLAYLKANYPIEFNISILQYTKDIKRKKLLNDIKKTGFRILKPNINYSSLEYKVSKESVLLPLTIIGGISESLASELINNRGEKYDDIYDFVIKNESLLNEKNYNIFVLSGLLDTFKINKKTLMENRDELFNYMLLGADASKPLLKTCEEYNDGELRNFENQYFGFYIGNHPCSIYTKVLKANKVKDYLFKNIDAILLIEKLTVIKTKKGEDMAFITASDETGEVELTLFPDVYKTISNLRENDIIYIKGKSSKRFDKYQIIVNNIKRKE